MAGTILAGVLLWSYWPLLVELVERWWHDPQYNHGFLVPLFAGFLLWLRWGPGGAAGNWRPSWWGVLIVTAGAGLRLAGGYFFFHWLEFLSLLPVIAGLVVLFGGWPALRWA